MGKEKCLSPFGDMVRRGQTVRYENTDEFRFKPDASAFGKSNVNFLRVGIRKDKKREHWLFLDNSEKGLNSKKIL